MSKGNRESPRAFFFQWLEIQKKRGWKTIVGFLFESSFEVRDVIGNLLREGLDFDLGSVVLRALLTLVLYMACDRCSGRTLSR